MRYAVVLLAAMSLTGCVPAPSVDATEAGGVATWYGTSPGAAIATADAHCRHYGRIARVNQVEGTGYLAFSCEKPGS